MEITEKEIKEAINILKKPVKVNTKIFRYFDEENYETLLEIFEKCLEVYPTYETLIEIKKEHKLLKDFIIEHGLWDELLKDKKILDWFDEDKEL